MLQLQATPAIETGGVVWVGVGQFSRWILKTSSYFAKIFLSWCSLKRNQNKENEMQWLGAKPGAPGLSCKMSFCICISERERDPDPACMLTHIETADLCVGETQVWVASDLLWGRELQLSPAALFLSLSVSLLL